MSDQPTVTTDEYFGGCPVCGTCEDVFNVRSSHWHVCHTHKKRWFVGENLFSHWQNENEEIWRLNRAVIEPYEDVEPVHADEEPLGRSDFNEEQHAKETAREQAVLDAISATILAAIPPHYTGDSAADFLKQLGFFERVEDVARQLKRDALSKYQRAHVELLKAEYGVSLPPDYQPEQKQQPDISF